MAKEDNDHFADEFEGDEFEDEDFSDSEFNLTDENIASEAEDSVEPISRANKREISLLGKLTAMKTQLIIVGVAILILLGYLMVNKNSSVASKNEVVDAGSKYAIKDEPHVAESIPKPELPSIKIQSKEVFQQKLKQDLPKQEDFKPAYSIVKPEINNVNLDKQTVNNIAANTAAITGMEGKILSLASDLSSSVEHIKQLSEVIIDLKSAISDVNQTLAGMDNRILSLTETVDHLNSDVSNVKHIIKDEDLDIANALDNQPAETLVYSAPEYVVHAIIPGRAWLKTDSGQIITVTEGDLLGDYGKVAFIDASNGIIRTSSGMVFK